MPQPLQPFLHDLVTVLAAPTQVLSDRRGDIASTTGQPTAQGVMHADVRVLSRAELTVAGSPGEHIATRLSGQAAVFTHLLRHVGAEENQYPDPAVRLDRRREVAPGLVTESVAISSVLPRETEVEVVLRLATDLAGMAAVKVGRALPFVAFARDPDSDRIRWGGDVTAELSAPGARLVLSEDRRTLSCHWPVTVPASGQVSVQWSIRITDTGGAVVAAVGPLLADEAAVALDDAAAARGRTDHRLRPWLEQSLADLNALRMAPPDAPEDVFFAAGAPWYLTLFGRDSLWAARLLLPVDLRPAAGTLRTLARLQGRRRKVDAAEEPGKIMHELRRGEYALSGISLPPLYFGTIDATPLWICLLHDAWRAGLDDAEVRTLLPALTAALSWLMSDADADGDGFLEYADVSGHGLANQGWKDSGDSIRFADGSLAGGSVALCEVQGYAYEAAMAGAALLDAFGQTGADGCRTWAGVLAERFRATFWCGEGAGRYPALALDGAKRRVDSVTSNIGHLLGTGILDPDEERLVARRVTAPELDSGLGLRTMSSRDLGYSPLSYHCGSVWPHDTAIVIGGLLRAGLAEHAAGLVEGLLRASVAFDQRLPELWSGEGQSVPYPAACRPQAWSAAAAVVVAQALAAG
jgi:hypothetical protein